MNRATAIAALCLAIALSGCAGDGEWPTLAPDSAFEEPETAAVPEPGPEPPPVERAPIFSEAPAQSEDMTRLVTRLSQHMADFETVRSRIDDRKARYEAAFAEAAGDTGADWYAAQIALSRLNAAIGELDRLRRRIVAESAAAARLMAAQGRKGEPVQDTQQVLMDIGVLSTEADGLSISGAAYTMAQAARLHRLRGAPAAASAETRTPLMVVRYFDSDVAFADTLQEVVATARERYPDIVFDVAAAGPGPTGAGASRSLEDLLRGMLSLAAAPDRITLHREAALTAPEVRLYVR